MRVRDLEAPVTAAKADWMGDELDWVHPDLLEADCRAAMPKQSNRQAARGYVLEYITENISEPSPRLPARRSLRE